VGTTGGAPGTENVRSALVALGSAYTTQGDMTAAVTALQTAINAAGTLDPASARAVSLELIHDRHNPWMKTALLYGLAIVVFGFSRLFLRRPLVILAILAAIAGVAEQILGIWLRVQILDRAPVTNTYEALLWMGLVAMAIGLVFQFFNRTGYYLFAALCAAFLSVLFANLVPLEDRTNSIPAVLRSNYWLIVHVLTVVASYGVFAVASVLSHVYLTRQILFPGRRAEELAARRSNPLVVQTYRCIQIGLLLLTAGTILGGVWAADSWGRFWGWDPKETWALISILVYFAVLHARYVRWIQDFGLATCSVLGFVVIVWTFYGVNYVMASGLHSYGFGSGGELWVGLWALAEILFLVACRLRYGAAKPPAPAAEPKAAAAAA
jgi:cytochrome c-type biogenesis protein CcsB